MFASVITMLGWQRGPGQDGEGDESEEDGRVPIKSSCNHGAKTERGGGKDNCLVTYHPPHPSTRGTTMTARSCLTHPFPPYPTHITPAHHSTPASPSRLRRWSDFCMPPLPPPPPLPSCCAARSTESIIPLRREAFSRWLSGLLPPPAAPTSSLTSPVWAILSRRAPSSPGRSEKGTG